MSSTLLLSKLKTLTINNARKVAQSLRGDEVYESLCQAIDRCEFGSGTREDWHMLIDMTGM